MSSKRIGYIDYLKGLSIIWVVWFHTIHPWFVDFSFRMPLFFLASGIFFKIADIRVYIQKKTNQLLVPFIFFTLIYYLYLIGQNYIAFGTLANFDFSCIWGVFEPHAGNESFVVDPPLWFICALFCQQIMTRVLVKSLKKKWAVAVAAVVLSAVGVIYVAPHPTYFMFGRSMPYLVYYVFGHLFGKDLIKILETNSKAAYAPGVTATLVFALSIILKETTGINPVFLTYIETFGLIVVLIYFFKAIYKFPIAYPFWFYGRNSYIVLGLHEVFQTVFLIAFTHAFGEINIWLGIVQTSLTLLILWPIIKILNKHVPMLVGKAELVNLTSLKNKITAF